VKVVICGSLRQLSKYKNAYINLQQIGCTILSPSGYDVCDTQNGFVYMQGELSLTPKQIEIQHLEYIKQSDFVWLFDNYVGLSTALEIGFAYANKIPILSDQFINDVTISQFITKIDSIATLINFNCRSINNDI